VLLAAALGLPIWHKREAVVSGWPLLGRAQHEAESTDNIAHELEKQVADYNFLLAKKHATYPVLALLEEVTRLLPDNTWVQQVDIKTVGKTREIQVSGEAPSSSKLIEVFETSPILHNAQTRGTVTRGSQPSLERFMIVAEPRARPAPETTSLLDAPEPVAPATPPAVPGAAAPAPAKPATVTPLPAKPPEAKAAPKAGGAR
jgi:general secretion pathway protein L